MVVNVKMSDISSILAEVEQLAKPATLPGAHGGAEKSTGDQALDTLRGIESLLAELLALHQAEEPPAEEPQPDLAAGDIGEPAPDEGGAEKEAPAKTTDVPAFASVPARRAVPS